MTRTPNIILIVADDMGYGDFGAFNPAVRTPTLDTLMAEGLTLTQHYSAAPVCAPARAALLTGRYPHRTGVTSVLEVRGQDRLALGEVTVADALRAAGYATALVGKWHVGAIGEAYHPLRRGFDEFAGVVAGWSDYYDWTLERNGAYLKADGRYLTDVFTEEAVDYVRRHAASGPFFLHLCYTAPHSPFQAPEDAVQRYLGEFSRPVSTIYAMIEIMDAGIGRLVEELQRQGIERDTLVMFTSDNGPRFRDSSGGVDTTRFNCGFAGAKMSVNEGGIRVPMVMRWPGVLPAGERFDGMIHFVDWLPTLLAAAGAERPGGLPLDGANVLPALLGQGGALPDTRYWQWNHYTPVGESNAAIRRGDWKLVRPPIPETMTADPADWALDKEHKQDWTAWDRGILTGPAPERALSAPRPPQLFNIAADPAEQHDLAAEERALVEELAVGLEDWFAEVMKEWHAARKEALGNNPTA